MNTKQIIDEQMKEFDEKFPVGKYGITYVLTDALKFHIKMFSRKLIESVAEEIRVSKKHHLYSPRSLGDGETVDVAPGYNQAIDDVSLKVKEIINSIEK